MKEFLPPGSGVCFCNTCGLTFNSLTAFDMHRVGELGEASTPRRCLSVAEMRQHAMLLNDAGRWITAARDERTIPAKAA